MIGPVLWLRSIRERFEFRNARIGLHKTCIQKQTGSWTGRKLCQVRLCVPKGSNALRLQGLKKAQGRKNLEPMIGYPISKRLRYRIQPMSHTHKRSYKKNFLAYIESALPKTVNPNETVPVNEGYCPRPLPFPQGMTVEWLACASTKAADRQKANIMSKKMTSSSNHFSISDGLAPIICARYPKNQLISFFAPIRS